MPAMRPTAALITRRYSSALEARNRFSYARLISTASTHRIGSAKLPHQ